MPAKLKVFRIPKMNTLVIKQTEGHFFVATKDSIVIDIFGLTSILKFLLITGMMSHKALEGVLEEYYNYAANKYNT
jgi:hypothetical protein